MKTYEFGTNSKCDKKNDKRLIVAIQKIYKYIFTKQT